MSPVSTRLACQVVCVRERDEVVLPDVPNAGLPRTLARPRNSDLQPMSRAGLSLDGMPLHHRPPDYIEAVTKLNVLAIERMAES